MGGKPLASNLTWQKGSTPSNEFHELSSPEAESTSRHQSLTKNLNANLEEAKKARARMDDIQSALAGIACGLPVIAYSGSETAAPVTNAGVVPVTENNQAEMNSALVRALRCSLSR